MTYVTIYLNDSWYRHCIDYPTALAELADLNARCGGGFSIGPSTAQI